MLFFDLAHMGMLKHVSHILTLKKEMYNKKYGRLIHFYFIFVTDMTHVQCTDGREYVRCGKTTGGVMSVVEK